MIITPTLVSLGVHPAASGSTLAVIIVVVSATAVIMALMTEVIAFVNFVFFFLMTFFGGLIFTYLLMRLINHYKVSSMMVFITAGL